MHPADSEGHTRPSSVRRAPLSRRALLTAASASILAPSVLGGCTTPRAEPSDDVPVEGAWDTDPDGDARVGFVGDVMLGRNLDDRYGGDASPAAVWGDLRPYLEGLDGLLCNLECTLSTRGERFPDRAYYFRADPNWAVPALEGAGVDFAALANNHLLDFGPTALRDTLDALDEGGIAHAGAGETPEAARAPALVGAGEVDLAVVAFADHFAEYAATEDRPGTAYLECDPADDRTRRAVVDALERAWALEPDAVVVSIHWGPNWVDYPDATYREFGRWLLDLGVDVVHGHSAHVVQGVEVHENGLLIHDAGDFVDDYTVKEDLRNDLSFCFEVSFEGGRPRELRLRPVRIDDLAVYEATGEDAAWIRRAMRERSEPFDTTFERDGESLLLSLDG